MTLVGTTGRQRCCAATASRTCWAKLPGALGRQGQGSGRSIGGLALHCCYCYSNWSRRDLRDQPRLGVILYERRRSGQSPAWSQNLYGSSRFGELQAARMTGMRRARFSVWTAVCGGQGRSAGAAMAGEIRISRVFHQAQLEILPIGMGTRVHLWQVQAVEVVRPDQGVGACVRENDACADC